MKLSSIDRRAITSQTIDGNGCLVTVFDRSTFADGYEMHPAGKLVNEPVTDNRGMDDESVYSESCTRHVGTQRIVVWDRGQYEGR